MRVHAELREAIASMRAGRQTFASFQRATAPHWDRIAARVYRMWSLPIGVSQEDVSQELLLGAWIATGRYDEARSPDLPAYVVWTAIARAKMFCQRQRGRGGKRAGDSALPSAHAFAFTSLARDSQEDGDVEERLQPGVPGRQAEEADARRRVGVLFDACDTAVERDALGALLAAEGDAEAAADLVHERPTWALVEAGTGHSRIVALRVVSDAARGALATAEAVSWVDPRSEGWGEGGRINRSGGTT